MKPTLGTFLRILAVVIYVQFLAAQFYDPELTGLGAQIWRILDPIMVLGLAVVIVSSFQRKRSLDAAGDGPVTRNYLEANFLFYFSAALMAGLLWNWIGFHLSDPMNFVKGLWTFIDVTLPLLLYATGRELARRDS